MYIELVFTSGALIHTSTVQYSSSYAVRCGAANSGGEKALSER